MKPLSALARTLCAGAAAAALFSIATPAQAASPAEEALSEVQSGTAAKNVVQNRFFYKERRFEVAPVVGVVPNNPMVRRYMVGGLAGYHLSENFSLGAQVFYSPDLGTSDLKGLTITLVQIAQGDETVDFRQPVDKMELGATFSANWSPVYGKINLVGETVLNFDLYLSAGLGFLAVKQYYAQYNGANNPPVELAPNTTSNNTGLLSTVPANLAIGMDVFLTQSVALKLDARSYIYLAPPPDYAADDGVVPSGIQPYNNFIASVGVSVFMPKMHPRLSNF